MNQLKEWKRRVFFIEGKEPHIYSLEEWYGKKHGIKDHMPDPSKPNYKIKFIDSFSHPELIESNYIQANKEGDKIHVSSEPYRSRGTKDFDLIHKYFGKEEEEFGPINYKYGKILVGFDLSLSIPKQMKLARELLQERKKQLDKSKKLKKKSIRQQHDHWKTYLRILDAYYDDARTEEIIKFIENFHSGNPKEAYYKQKKKALELSKNYKSILFSNLISPPLK